MKEWCPLDLVRHDRNHTTENFNNLQNENFICTDHTGLMYSFSVENNFIKDGSKILPDEGLLNNLTSIAIKKDLIIFGDLDGNLSIWNVTLKSSKLIASKLGPIRKLKFAPGKENFLLLISYSDKIQVYEIKTQELISSFKLSSIRSLEIVDSDWCASDRIVLSLSNGCINIYDIYFKKIVDERKYLPSISCARVMQPMGDFMHTFSRLNRFLYQTIDVLVEAEDNFNFESLTTIIDAYCGENFVLKSVLDNVHADLKDVLFRKCGHTSLTHKISSFAYLAMYLNCCPFEIRFWTFLAYSLCENKESIDLFKANPLLLDVKDFRQNEYELFKLRNEKRVMASNADLTSVYRDLLLCNEQDLVFNLLVETDSGGENYLNNCYK